MPRLDFISTSLHRQMQSIRFILDFFALAPAEHMNNLTTLLPGNLLHCQIWEAKKPLWGTKTENVFPELMENAMPQTLSCYKTITIQKKRKQQLKSQLMQA